jgi:hypothetical protein
VALEQHSRIIWILAPGLPDPLRAVNS